MDANNNTQQEARLPQIHPESYQALTTLDSFLAKAPLTRMEHGQSNACIQHLAQRIEQLEFAEKELRRLKSVIEQEKKASAGGEVVSEVIKDAFEDKTKR